MFIAEVKKQLSLRNWEYKDLAKLTGYKCSTINAFMASCRESERVAIAIANALDIKKFS